MKVEHRLADISNRGGRKPKKKRTREERKTQIHENKNMKLFKRKSESPKDIKDMMGVGHQKKWREDKERHRKRGQGSVGTEVVGKAELAENIEDKEEEPRG